MLKYLCLPGCVILLTALHPAMAQTDSTLTQKIVKEFCNEFSKKEFTKLKGAELEIGLIAVPIIEKYKNEIEKEWNLSTENDDEYSKISEKIGQEAAVGCPKFLEFVRNNLNDIADDEDESELKEVSGNFLRMEEQTFSTVVIKTKTGKEEKLWWLGYFEGEDRLKKPASLANKNITVKYSELEVYDPRLKDYRAIKVIKNIVVK